MGKKDWEKLVEETLRDYFDKNYGCLIRGNIRIEEENGVIKIYRKCTKSGKFDYDIGIVP